MNFVIKSIAYWVIVIMALTLLGNSFDSSQQLKEKALQQFEDTIQPTQDIAKLQAKRNTNDITVIALLLLAIAVYSKMFYTFLQDCYKEKISDEKEI